MSESRRTPSIRHCTSHPLVFFGRRAELDLLDRALDGGEASLVAMIGPGGQGKTAIVQHWLERLSTRGMPVDGLFLWSFYRGKDSDLCLRELFAYAEGMDQTPEVSAGFCVDRLIPRLRSERWALVLDGTEIVQHESGSWYGRFVHPELGRLLEELASAPMPGVIVMTSRFDMPTLLHRRHARLLPLSTLDEESGAGLLQSLGVRGSDKQLRDAARGAGLHAKAVELLGTWLVRYQDGDVAHEAAIPAAHDPGASPEELHVARILGAFHGSMSLDLKDVLALATAFRQPPTQRRFLEYLVSDPVHQLLHETWQRSYVPFRLRATEQLADMVQQLVTLRLLERVGLTVGPQESDPAAVLDAHPLVRRGFEDVLGAGSGATARAGFLRGRPDRRPPQSLEEAREEVELFHAYIAAGLWNEADSTLIALDNPKHRFLAPAFERDLLVQFFPGGDWRQPPLWSGFGRHRSLAICCELLGQFEEALEIYRPADAPLRGDALLALGRLDPLVDVLQAAHPWRMLWQSYRAHALALRGRNDEALRLARAALPVDIYEWVHIFEAMLRLRRLDLLDMNSVLYQPPLAGEHRWANLARRRMRADYTRLMRPEESAGLGTEYRELLDAYDRAGLPWERALTRLSYARWLAAAGQAEEAHAVRSAALDIARRFRMVALEVDALDQMDQSGLSKSLRQEHRLQGPPRP